MALGETLRNARVQKGLSPSDVAESTHMMVQVVEELEREDFRRIAAPIYGRGFVRLYAELLELDPEPLIRDFMDLYSGSHAPAVRTKRVEPQSIPAPAVEKAPAAEGDGALSSIPQRQAVQPRPLVRPLTVPQTAPAAPSREKGAVQPAVRVEEEKRPSAAAKTDERLPVAPLKLDSLPEEPGVVSGEPLRPELIVEPEEVYTESDEPDLFKPLPPRRKAAASPAAVRGGETTGRRPLQKPKHPIFKIGGRMNDPLPESQDEMARARGHERVQKFVDGFNRLMNGVKHNLPSKLRLPAHIPWPSKQVAIFGGVGLVALICIGFGIRTLFKMTGSNVKESPTVTIKRVAPPPDLYID